MTLHALAGKLVFFVSTFAKNDSLQLQSSPGKQRPTADNRRSPLVPRDQGDQVFHLYNEDNSIYLEGK